MYSVARWICPSNHVLASARAREEAPSQLRRGRAQRDARRKHRRTLIPDGPPHLNLLDPDPVLLAQDPLTHLLEHRRAERHAGAPANEDERVVAPKVAVRGAQAAVRASRRTGVVGDEEAARERRRGPRPERGLMRKTRTRRSDEACVCARPVCQLRASSEAATGDVRRCSGHCAARWQQCKGDSRAGGP